jgi:hypothetical protein
VNKLTFEFMKTGDIRPFPVAVEYQMDLLSREKGWSKISGERESSLQNP